MKRYFIIFYSAYLEGHGDYVKGFKNVKLSTWPSEEFLCQSIAKHWKSKGHKIDKRLICITNLSEVSKVDFENWKRKNLTEEEKELINR